MGRRKSKKVRCAGIALTEVMIATALAAVMCSGLYAMGLAARRSAEHNRLLTEVRSFAKERLEEMIAAGKSNLAKPSCALLDESQLKSPLTDRSVKRVPRVVWHAADASVVAPEDAAYAELHVAVYYQSLHSGKTLSETYSMLIQ